MLLLSMSADLMFSLKDFFQMVLPVQIMSMFDDECDMSPYQD